jgi:hypothetical protein
VKELSSLAAGGEQANGWWQWANWGANIGSRRSMGTPQLEVDAYRRSRSPPLCLPTGHQGRRSRADCQNRSPRPLVRLGPPEPISTPASRGGTVRKKGRDVGHRVGMG